MTLFSVLQLRAKMENEKENWMTDGQKRDGLILKFDLEQSVVSRRVNCRKRQTTKRKNTMAGLEDCADVMRRFIGERKFLQRSGTSVCRHGNDVQTIRGHDHRWDVLMHREVPLLLLATLFHFPFLHIIGRRKKKNTHSNTSILMY